MRCYDKKIITFRIIYLYYFNLIYRGSFELLYNYFDKKYKNNLRKVLKLINVTVQVFNIWRKN